MDREEVFAGLREKMVEEQIAARGVREPRLLQAFREVPRHLFVPGEHAHLAYIDGPLPIGEGQTISQPFIVALMTQLLELEGDETVLEIGTGSGYQAAILARLARQVYSVEQYPALARHATHTLARLGFENVRVFEGDGSLGLPEFAPYRGIVITAAAPKVAQAVLDQLADQAWLVAPVGGRKGQVLQRWQRRGDTFAKEKLIPVAFVPLRGESGWKTRDWAE